ncbi:ABC transporter ATP-binding protein [Lacicoccus alkaliphilus]|uniref:Carnitine transport ATP-binding protein OpuCA n=1 Tax=Lacicoccus alkaliphilus DSM 16010 TaxID=1123231 RepID=A0A1M7E2Y8_9BACL|nr:ABC transporter ATP-binding protein [Salinicoccus alkaliphilus]SHL86131.1 osmoprotectant transport system ATP-binding protein [Salinicoccus alkaliphilus DSM 16010]
MIEFKNVSKKYGEDFAVEDVNFKVEEGEFFVIIGPSGCGKTTTLKMINRLIPLTEGYIYFKEQPISEFPLYEMRWDIGYVLQQIALFPHMTIRENIAQVPEMKGWKNKDIDARVDELLEMVGLEPGKFRDRLPGELSGGQKQRVGVIRALAADPPVILMDEPFSALDPISRESLQDDLIELQKKIKKTVVFVTHDIQEALKMGDRICLLNKGRVEQIGTPEAFLTHPENDFVSDFIGDVDGYMMKRATAADVVKTLPAMEEGQTGEVPEVPHEADINTLFKYFSTHDRVTIVGDGARRSLSREELFKYLSGSESGDVR